MYGFFGVSWIYSWIIREFTKQAKYTLHEFSDMMQHTGRHFSANIQFDMHNNDSIEHFVGLLQ